MDACLVAALKSAMRRMPAPIALITAGDRLTGEPAGLAASAVIPVAMDPPSMLISVNRSASAHAVIEREQQFCVNLLCCAHTGLVAPFSRSDLRTERFADAGWSARHGLPYLEGAAANIFCTVEASLVFGTHEVFIGEVFDIKVVAAVEPLGWFEGDFAQVSRLMA